MWERSESLTQVPRKVSKFILVFGMGRGSQMKLSFALIAPLTFCAQLIRKKILMLFRTVD